MFIILFVLWIIFNGKVTFEILWIGLLVSGAIYLFCWKFLGYAPRRELCFAKKAGLLLKYAGLLLVEIFKANITVLKIILGRKKPYPVLLTFRADLRSAAARVLLSQSITLTPGTITVELKENEFTVHCLDASLAEGMEDSEFIHLLQKIELKEETNHAGN